MLPIYTVNYELPPTVQGDEWTGLAIGPVVVNGITQGTLSRISMVFVGPNSPTVYQADSSAGYDATIVITNAGTWIAHISPVANFLNRRGDWTWDMKFYHSGNVSPITCYAGTITVVPTTDP